MKTGVYRQSVKARREASRRLMNKAYRAHAELADKTTPYAQELAALADLHACVWIVWHAAANDIGEGAAE